MLRAGVGVILSLLFLLLMLAPGEALVSGVPARAEPPVAGEDSPNAGRESAPAEATGPEEEDDENGFLAPYQEPEAPEAANPLQVFLRVILSLGLVVGLFYLLARFLKSRGGLASARHMEVADRLSLGVNRDVFIVRLGEQYLVLGVTGEKVSLLGEVSDPGLQAQLGQELEESRSFADALAQQRAEEKRNRLLSLGALEEQVNRLRSSSRSHQQSGERGT